MRESKILIVDDDPSMVKFVQANLRASHYRTLAAVNGDEAIRAVELNLPDLIILDIMMPGMDGFEVCRRIREWSQVPIIMLTARGDEQDKVRCLDLGADDYLLKPFGVDELLARIRSVMRRVEMQGVPASAPVFTTGELEIDFSSRCVTLAGKKIEFTPTEYRLLKELAQNAGKVITHEHLLQRVWGPEYHDERQYLHVFIGRIRSKLGSDPEHQGYLVSVPGVGYQIRKRELHRQAFSMAGSGRGKKTRKQV